MKKFRGLYIFIIVFALFLAAAFSPVISARQAFAAQPNLEALQSNNGNNSQTVTGNSNPGSDAAEADNQGNATQKPDTASCIGVRWAAYLVPIPTLNLDACAANIMYLIMWIFSWILWLAGIILDMSIFYTLHLSDLMTHVPAVDIGWKIFRDLANICFIFILLWIAIGTILGLTSGKTKEILVNLIVVALLINFSLFITKAVVDASNIVALHFYELITTPQASGGSQGTTMQNFLSAATPRSSFSGAFMEGLKIQTLYNTQTPSGKVLSAAGAVPGVAAGTMVDGGIINFGKIILAGVLGIALMLVAAYVFFVAAILFIIRVVVLMMLMILSPVAFLAFVLPSTEGYADAWKEALIKNCLFAPIYMILSYVVVKTIQSPQFVQVMSIPTTADSLASVFTPGATGGLAILFNFVLLIGLMLGSILVAKKMEAYGVETATHLGKEATGFVGRQIVRGTYVPTVARAANFVGLGRVSGAVGTQLQKLENVPGFKALGKFGKNMVSGSEKMKTAKGREELQKSMDINEWDKKFRQSKFGASELGSFIRERTTGGALFGVKAKFGAEKSVSEAYEESEKLRSRRFAIENMEGAEKSAEELAEAEKNEYVEKPNWQDEKYRKTNGDFDKSKFDEDFYKYIEQYRPQRADFAPERYDKKYKNADGTLNRALIDKDTAAKQLVYNKKYRNPDGTFNQAAFDTDAAAGDAEFKKATAHFDDRMQHQPDRDDFADDATFGAYQKEFEEWFEKPKRADYALGAAGDASLEMANKIKDNRETRRANKEKTTEMRAGTLGSFLNRVTPEEFSDMDEEKIREMARYANLRQLKAVMASEHWTQPEKIHMLGVRWEKEVGEYKNFSDNVVKPYKEALDKLADALRGQKLQIDKAGNIQKKRDDGTQQVVTDPSDGKQYVNLSVTGADGKSTELFNPDGSHQRLEMPEAPKLPSHLKSWARNKMTKEEYEMASLVSPELFDNPDLVHVIRWGLTNKEFRTDENMDFNLRDRMTYMKDSELDRVVKGAGDPDYIEEDDDKTRKLAYDTAKSAAEAAKAAGKSAEEIDDIFRTIYARMTPNDTVRRQITVSWGDGRAPNEIAGARGRNRNSLAVHRIIDAGIAQYYREKDSEDMKWLLKDVLTDYLAEEQGRGIVTKENRDLIRYLFTDPRSKTLARPIADLSSELQDVYHRLEAQGDYNQANKITFASDQWRGGAGSGRTTPPPHGGGPTPPAGGPTPGGGGTPPPVPPSPIISAGKYTRVP